MTENNQAAQPASSAGGQEPVTRRERDLMLALGAADVSVSGGFDGVPWKIHLPTAAPVAGEAAQLPLAVWCGAMPESNGKQNWTVILHRAGADAFAGPHVCLFRSEYPDRMRYEADRVKYLLGQREDDPDILAYDSELHSGYVQPAPAAVPADAVRAAAERALAAHDAFQERPGRSTGKEANEADKALREAIANATQPAAPQGVDLGRFRGLTRSLRKIVRRENGESIWIEVSEAKAILSVIDSQHQQQESGA